MDNIASLEPLLGSGHRVTGPARLVTLCGSIRPLHSGNDDFQDNLSAVLTRMHIDVRPVDLGRWGLNRVPELLRQVASEQPDAILMQYPTDAFNTALGPHVYAALQRQAPLFVTLHEFATANVLRRASIGLLIARAKGVVTTAETERRSLVKWYPWAARRVSMIPIGSNFPGLPWQPSLQPTVAYFGQIRPEKGIEEFLACCDQLTAQFPEVEFVIAGSRVPKFTSYHQQVEREARARNVRLLGELQAQDVPQFLRSITIALLPFPTGASFRRGSLLAAAACGVPIVTLQGEETPAEMTRLLQPAQTQEALVAQAATYLSDIVARETAHEASLRLDRLLSWDTIGDSYVDLIFPALRKASQS